jgi:hypothetical protein
LTCWLLVEALPAKKPVPRPPILASASPSSNAPSTPAAVASIPEPSLAKRWRESALYFSGLKQRGLYDIDYSLKENLTVNDFMHHEREVVEMERQRILKNLALHQIELISGQGAFEDAHTIAVSSTHSTRRLRSEIILIASGSKPHRPPEIAFDDVHTFDSDTFLQMDRIPKSLAVIGGGVIGSASMPRSSWLWALRSRWWTAVTCFCPFLTRKFPRASANALQL